MHQVNLAALSPNERRKTSQRFVAKILDVALEALALRAFCVELDVVTDRQIRTLNSKHRSKDKPTDVLSFPNYEAKNGKIKPEKWEQPPFMLGNIVIANGVARRQAKEFAHPLHAEVARLIVHSVCHLAGYDHDRSPRDETRMFAVEDLILDRLRKQKVL